MNFKELSNYKNIYFIGIGGISMSGLAETLHKNGKNIIGSDRSSSNITEHLTSLGIEVHYSQDSKNITSDIDLVVYTAAIKSDNFEYQQAKNLNIPMMTRAKLLGCIMDAYKKSISVAGTHGKTTTTSMFSHILLGANLDPTISVGGILPKINGNFKSGESDYFITEACEYTNSYHQFFPYLSLILNVEADHLDFFKDLDEIRESFKKYIGNTNSNGAVVICDQIENYKDLITSTKATIITFGENPSSDYSYSNLTYDKLGHLNFTLLEKGVAITDFELKTTGKHNLMNALATIAGARFLGLSIETIKSGLYDFSGVNRRLQLKGSFNDVRIFDDYAHHPTEIKATLNSIKNIAHREAWIIFQPHTYTRTKSLFNDFVDALKHCDHLIITDIYAAREKDPGDINSSMLVQSIQNSGGNAIYIDKLQKIAPYLEDKLIPQDMLITMGAGNVYLVGESLLSK